MLDREADTVELMAMSTPVPGPLADLYQAIGEDPATRRSYLDSMGRFADLEGRSPAGAEDEIRALVAALSEDEVVQALAVPEVESAEDEGPSMEDLIPDPAQREVIRLTLSRLEERGRS